MRYNYQLHIDNSEYKLYEVPSKLVIQVYHDLAMAKEVLYNLNMGGGFGGRTPFFFLPKTLRA